MLQASRLDKRWKLTASQNSERDSGVIRADLLTCAETLLLPFLARFQTELDAAEFLAQGVTAGERFVEPGSSARRHAYAGLIYMHLRRVGEATAELERASVEALETSIENEIAKLRLRLTRRAM